jgi:PhnB protein
MTVKPIPEGYRTLTTYLAVDDATKAIEFYERAFGAKERSRMPGPNGTIAHAEIVIGDSVVMLSDPFPQASVKPPAQVGGTTAGLFMYVEDVDAAYRRAIDAGATETMPPEDMFWGDRFGTVTDPFGHSWQIATHVEDLTPEEMAKRGQEAMASMAQT